MEFKTSTEFNVGDKCFTVWDKVRKVTISGIIIQQTITMKTQSTPVTTIIYRVVIDKYVEWISKEFIFKSKEELVKQLYGRE